MNASRRRYLAIIPARAGSKRLPDKNVRPLAGKPLVQWTIEAALASERVDTVLVSTDSERIAKVARRAGALAPFLRPAELATDTTPTDAVLHHALAQWEKASGRLYDYVALLQPTSPLRTARHIDEAIALCEARAAQAVISVCPSEHPREWINTLPADDDMRDFLPPEARGKRSQDLPQAFRLNGAISVLSADIVRRGVSVWSLDDGVFAYRMSVEDSVDIDTAVDFMLADLLLRQRLRMEKRPATEI